MTDLDRPDEHHHKLLVEAITRSEDRFRNAGNFESADLVRQERDRRH